MITCTVHQRYRQTDGQTDTDRQTDRQTTYYGNTALRYASRGKNVKNAFLMIKYRTTFVNVNKKVTLFLLVFGVLNS